VTQVVTGILIGAVVAAVGALVNYLLGVQRDRQRWDREDERQRDRWNREDQQRREEWDHEHDFRDYEERRSAYSEFMASTDRLFAGDHSEEAFQEYRQRAAVVRLIAPAEVEKAADKLGTLPVEARWAMPSIVGRYRSSSKPHGRTWANRRHLGLNFPARRALSAVRCLPPVAGPMQGGTLR
jgi:hypothetical protein